MKNIYKHIVFILVLLLIFLGTILIFENLTISDCSFIFSIILLLLAFFTKKDSSVMPTVNNKVSNKIGVFNVFSISAKVLKSNSDFNKDKIIKEYYNENEKNFISIVFFIYGVLFMLISILSLFLY